MHIDTLMRTKESSYLNEHIHSQKNATSEKQQLSYDRWLAQEMLRSTNDPRPRIPHNEVMQLFQGVQM